MTTIALILIALGAAGTVGAFVSALAFHRKHAALPRVGTITHLAGEVITGGEIVHFEIGGGEIVGTVQATRSTATVH